MAAPAVQQYERVIRAKAAKGERPNDVVRIRNALAREVHRGSELLENLARLGGPLLLDLLGCEHVHRDGELVRSRVPRAGTDHDVHRGEPDRLGVQREVLAGGLRLGHGDADDLRHAAEQPRGRGWLVRWPARARVPRSRSRASMARSSKTLWRNTASSQLWRVRPTRTPARLYAGSSGLNRNVVSGCGPFRGPPIVLAPNEFK